MKVVKVMSPLLIGLSLRNGFAVRGAVLVYLGDATNLTGILNPSTATIIAALALGIEHNIEAKTGNALFGAVHTGNVA